MIAIAASRPLFMPAVCLSGKGQQKKKLQFPTEPFSKVLQARDRFEARRAKQLKKIARALDECVEDELRAIQELSKGGRKKNKDGRIEVDFGDWTAGNWSAINWDADRNKDSGFASDSDFTSDFMRSTLDDEPSL